MEKSPGGSHHRHHEDENSSDEESQSDSEPMDVIEKSPYEANMNAEKGEALFTRLKKLLKNRTGENDHQAEVLNWKKADSKIEAVGLIERSGKFYCPKLCSGRFEVISKRKLLLCLVSSRFAKADEIVLARLSEDFKINACVQRSIKFWNLSASYPKIMGVSSENVKFQSSIRDFYKCAIFIGRAYTCHKVLRRGESIDSSLMAKIKSCLDLMERYLADPPVSPKEKKMAVDLAAVAEAAPNTINMKRSTGGRRHRHHEDKKLSDDEFQSDSEPMDVIERSPYEANLNAEKGVELFTRVKNLLKNRTEENDFLASKDFRENARCLVDARALIEKSGMLYSEEWCLGRIRDNRLGPIPKELLLLCLVSSRLAKAQDILLASLMRDFDITMSVLEAIEAWNLSTCYPCFSVYYPKWQMRQLYCQSRAKQKTT